MSNSFLDLKSGLGITFILVNVNRERKAHMESEIVNMNRALDMLKFKCWYYEQAIQDGNEDRVKALIPDNLPEEIKDTYDNAHTQ